MLLWSLSNVAAKQLAHIPSMDLVFFRSIISMAIFSSVIAFQNARIKSISKLAIRGTLSGVGLILSYLAIPLLTISSLGFLSQLAPIITMLVAVVLLKERLTARQIVLALICVTGVLISFEFDSSQDIAPALLIITAMVCSAIGYILVRDGRGDEHPAYYTFSSAVVGMAITFPLASYDLFHQFSFTEWSLLLGLGILTSLAQLLTTRAYQIAEASRVSFFNYLGIPYALLLGWIFFNESIGHAQLIGAIIILSTMIANYRYKPANHE